MVADQSVDPHDHSHPSANARRTGGGCDNGTCGVVAPADIGAANGRSFQVSGLDCAEEVAILNKVVGPEIGGAEHLAFDIVNGRMALTDTGTH